MLSERNTEQVFGQRKGGKTAGPLIEVSEQNAGTLQLRIDQYLRAEQFECLPSSLHETSTQVNIKNMHCAPSDLYVGSKAAKFLPPAISYVKVADGGYR